MKTKISELSIGQTFKDGVRVYEVVETSPMTIKRMFDSNSNPVVLNSLERLVDTSKSLFTLTVEDTYCEVIDVNTQEGEIFSGKDAYLMVATMFGYRSGSGSVEVFLSENNHKFIEL